VPWWERPSSARQTVVRDCHRLVVITAFKTILNLESQRYVVKGQSNHLKLDFVSLFPQVKQPHTHDKPPCAF
jgi:hypothetical protein